MSESAATPRRQPSILLVSSHVCRGAVGLRAASFACERLGLSVWSAATVTLPWHPGHGRSRRIVPGNADFADYMKDVAASPWAGELDVVVTGYLGNPEQAAILAKTITRLKEINPALVHVCDPVIGDVNGLYVPEQTAMEIRDRLLPLADVATPNIAEFRWLVGQDMRTGVPTELAATTYPGVRFAITSAPALMRGSIGVLILEEGRSTMIEHRAFPKVPNGTGDLFAALVAAHLGKRMSLVSACQHAAASVHDVIVGTVQFGADELMISRFQSALVQPATDVQVRQMAAVTPRRVPRKAPLWVVGVDGCPAGWVAVFRDVTGTEAPQVAVFEHFGDLLADARAPQKIAVDMPIGLPSCIDGSGRPPESAVRPLLGPRQSSVFSVPSRSAVYSHDFASACVAARKTSKPPRKVSRQSFNLFPKIREIDELMSIELTQRVFEVHPEVAFWRLNGERPMENPKKIKSRPNPEGLEERRALLAGNGFSKDFLTRKVGRGVGADDLLDAAVNAVIAKRLLDGTARPFPEPPRLDDQGIPMAIWA